MYVQNSNVMKLQETKRYGSTSKRMASQRIYVRHLLGCPFGVSILILHRLQYYLLDICKELVQRNGSLKRSSLHKHHLQFVNQAPERYENESTAPDEYCSRASSFDGSGIGGDAEELKAESGCRPAHGRSRLFSATVVVAWLVGIPVLGVFRLGFLVWLLLSELFGEQHEAGEVEDWDELRMPDEYLRPRRRTKRDLPQPRHTKRYWRRC